MCIIKSQSICLKFLNKMIIYCNIRVNVLNSNFIFIIRLSLQNFSSPSHARLVKG